MITDQQYNAVVAQNKSLQGELRLYKKIATIMAECFRYQTKCNDCYFKTMCVSHTYSNCANNILQMVKSEALQELEAEND